MNAGGKNAINVSIAGGGLAGMLIAFLREGERCLARASMRARLDHPLTGCSVPHAVRLADLIAASADLSGASLHQVTRTYSVEQRRDATLYRQICRMLFKAAEPDQRYEVIERFYKLPQPLIERLYAVVSPIRDKARTLVGKPPVPITEVLECF